MTALNKILKSVRNQRYAQDFEQERKIGIGGYASVYKSKNVLDDQFYAVKKIKLKMKNLKQSMEEEIERVLQEVKVLAKVNHPNILRYFNSWLEVQWDEKRKKSFELFDKKQEALSPSNFLRKDQKLSLKSSRDYEAFEDQSDDENIVFSNEDESSQNNETREVDVNQRSYEDDLLEFTDESPTFVFEGREKRFKPNELKRKQNEDYGGENSMSIFNSLKKVQIADKFAEFASKINKEIYEPVSKAKAVNSLQYNHSFDDIKRNLKPASTETGILLSRRHSSKSKNAREVIDLKDERITSVQKQALSAQETQKDAESLQLESIKSITLYIQTELCHSTLEDYITERNALLEKKKNDPECRVLEDKYLREAFKFAREIINGLDYIHSVCGMVHRDLKPSNILLTEDKEVKIGDFGLVKKMKSLSAFSPSPLSLSPIVSGVPTPERNSFLDQQEKIEPFTLNKSNFENNCEFELKIDDDEKLSVAEESLGKAEFSFEDGIYNEGLINSPLIHLPKADGVDCLLLNSPNRVRHFTKDVGTKTFASPEQLSADSESFDERADIWSLGIIFLLLFHPMVTSMEQTRAIHNAKKGTLPSKFEEERPALASIIKKMLSTDPSQRPYLKEVESELKKPSDKLNKFFGKILIRREGSSQWKERWLRIADKTALIFKKPEDKKAAVVFALSEWQITLLSEKLKSNGNPHPLMNPEDGLLRNPLTLISIESQIQFGYEIAADDTPATLLIHKQMTDN